MKNCKICKKKTDDFVRCKKCKKYVCRRCSKIGNCHIKAYGKRQANQLVGDYGANGHFNRSEGDFYPGV